MKKILALLLAVAMVFSFAACSKDQTDLEKIQDVTHSDAIPLPFRYKRRL